MNTAYADTDWLKDARARFKAGIDADTKQVQREHEDLAFYAGDQWPQALLDARQGQPAQGGFGGMPALPERPSLVINKVREPVRQVQNEIRDTDIGVELTPADDFGDLGITPDDTEIALREGLARRIIRDSDGQDAWNWAGDRADIAGRGYFAVLTRYLPGRTNDQEIYLHRIYNQSAVVGDPSRVEPDGKDADWWFVGTWVPWDRFAGEYPTLADGESNPFASASESEFMGLEEDYPEWYQSDGEQRSVRVTDHWYTERTNRVLVTLSDGSVQWEDELPDPLPESVTETDRRTVVEKHIKFCKIGGGVLELERTDWPWLDMPIIETLGEEMHPYDGDRRVEGMIRNARGAQMGENYMISKFVEVVGLTPLPALHVDPLAIEGYESWYAVANTRALPYLPSRTYGDEGQPFKEPHRPAVDPNILPMAQGIAMFDQFIKSTTAVPDPTLGNVDPSLKSGRAIRETVANAKGSTSNFLTNRIRSIRRAATVINNGLYPIYGARPGRVVRVMTGTGASETMVIGDPSQGGQAPSQGLSGQVPPGQTLQAKAAKVGKLTEDAHFNMAVKVTKNWDTRRQQEFSELGELIARNPAAIGVVGDLYAINSDMPNRKEIAKRFRVMLAPPVQAMLAQEEQGQQPLPPQVQAQMAEMAGRLKELEGIASQMHQTIETKQVEQAAKVEQDRIKAAADLKLAEVERDRDVLLQQMKNATAIRVAEIAAETKGIVTGHTLAHERVALQEAQAHEATMADLDREAGQQDAASGMAHEAALADGSADQATALSEQGHAQALEQQQAAQTQEPVSE